jgi:hypothetical protein
MIEPELEAEERLGTAVVVPCLERLTKTDHLIDEAKALWAAEEDDLKEKGALSSNWGSVGLLKNPESDVPDGLLGDWKKRVDEEEQYAELLVPASGSHPLRSDGLLAISWPSPGSSNEELGVDIILATATGLREARGEYPSPEEIARAWIGAEYLDYFCENRANGISTFEDDDIISLLSPRE